MSDPNEQSPEDAEKLYFEDLAVGDTFSFGSKTMEQQEIIEFAEQFDPQYFHTDEVAARDSLFGGLVASGWHTVSVCNRLIIDDVFSNISVMGGTGTDDLRWPSPVRPGDSIKGVVRVVETRNSGYENSGHIEMTIDATNQYDEPVLTMTNTIIVEKIQG